MMADAWAVTAGAVFAATAVQVISGFGFAVVAVPLLALLMPPQAAVQAIILVDLPLVMLVAVHEKRWICWPAVRRLSTWSLAGIPLGVLALRMLSQRTAGIALGILVLVLVAGVGRERVRFRGPWLARVGGTMSGMLMGLSAMSGPPIVAVLRRQALDPQRFRATAAAIFGAEAVASLTILLASGSLSKMAVQAAVVGVPAAYFGWLAANRIFLRVAVGVSARIVPVLLVLVAVTMIVRSIAQGSA